MNENEIQKFFCFFCLIHNGRFLMIFIVISMSSSSSSTISWDFFLSQEWLLLNYYKNFAFFSFFWPIDRHHHLHVANDHDDDQNQNETTHHRIKSVVIISFCIKKLKSSSNRMMEKLCWINMDRMVENFFASPNNNTSTTDVLFHFQKKFFLHH